MSMASTPREPKTKSGAGPTDAALVIAARAGDAWAQEALFQRHSRMALGLAHRLLPGHPEVDDVTQDSFVYALSKLGSLSNPQAFASWLCSIVVRTASKRLRRQRLLVRLGIRRTEPIEPDTVVARSAPPEVMAELRAVYSLLSELSVEQRVALVLRRVDGLSVPEVAQNMGLSVSTVKRRLKLAEARLERSLGR